MSRIRTLFAALLALVPLALVLTAGAAQAENRIALVVGNAGYQAGALNTPANDAGLIAQTLQAAGFDVVGARDLDQDSLRHALRDFVEKATGAGPDTVAFVYLAGYGVQLEGDNYFVPIDARIARDADIAAQAIRLSDYTRPLAALGLKASVIVLDAARANPFAQSGAPLAGGLALVDPEPGMLIAFNAAPGTVAPEGQGPYGPYAQGLAEMLREGGLPIADAFDRARLRVNDMTKGAEVPWHASKVEAPVMLFERAPDAPPAAVPIEQTVAIRAKPIRELPATDAYAASLERDTVQGYSDFIAAYPRDPMTGRVRAILAARREAITWRRSRAIDTPPAYWSYLRRYPEGPHAGDCHRRLAYLAAAFEPPPTFAVLAYDLPPPPPEEIVYIRRPVLVFDDPVFAFAPPPPPPIFFLAPPPPEFVVLEPPPPPIGVFWLPIPVYTPVPVWVSPPAYVAPPPNNVIFQNVHNTVVVNNVTNTVIITNPQGKTTTVTPPAPAPGAKGAPVAAAAFGAALPPSVAQKAALQSPAPQGAGAQPAAPSPAAKQLPGQPSPGMQPLPGMRGQPLPSAKGAPQVPQTPSAAIVPGTPSPAPSGSARPATPALHAPAATLATPTTPAAPIKPVTPSPTLLPGGNAKTATPPAHPPALNLATPTTPAAPIKPVTPSPTLSPGRGAKAATPPAHPPAATLATPTTPAAPIKPVTPSPLLAPSGVAAPAATPPAHAPAAKLAPPPPPPASPKLAPPPSPPPAARLAPPPPPPPPPKPAAPPPQMAPAAAAVRPAPPPAPPAPKGCPPGKTMAVVNGQPTCK